MSVRAQCVWAVMVAMVCAAVCRRGARADVSGVWDVTMVVGEHTLPFAIEIPPVPGREATITLRGVRTVSAPVWDNGDEVRIDFPRHNARIRATRIGDRLYGEWLRERTIGERVTIERLEFSALRSPVDSTVVTPVATAAPAKRMARPLPLRWNSEPDECGSAHAYTIRCDAGSEDGGDVVARTVSAEGRLVNYVGRWSDATQTLTLERFDGEEAEVIVATREGAGPLVGQYWLGGHMPLPWVVHPIVTVAPAGSKSESGGTIAYP